MIEDQGVSTARNLPREPGQPWNGQDLKYATGAASSWLSRNAVSINALNVFPVPDGDTGTNMALTMQAAMEHIESNSSEAVDQVAQGLAYGALMGARGNSGVILSQILRGFAEGVVGKAQIEAREFAAALVTATATAYRAVLKPVEGTILTVIRETGEGARAAAEKDNSFACGLAASAEAAYASVARTPTLLDKLRDAGVVDAGGQGLYIFFDGMRRAADGENIADADLPAQTAMVPGAEQAGPHVNIEHGEYGYCTNFILVGGGWNFDKVRADLAGMGESAVIVGDGDIVKVHIHTEKPGEILNYAVSLGNLRQIGITDMQEQHDGYMMAHAGGATKPKGPAAVAETGAGQVSGRIGVLAVASGAGLVNAFRSMGATAIVEGGQTMNPSTQDLLRAIDGMPQEEVLLLPNNGNVIMAARQTQTLSKKRVVVVPTDTMPQGMAALIAFNYDADLEDNARNMETASSSVQTGEITRSVRDASVGGLAVRAGDIIGLLNNKLVMKGVARDEVGWDLLDRMGASERELITIYWGGAIDEHEARRFSDAVRLRFPASEVEIVHGGQPFYDYIFSVE